MKLKETLEYNPITKQYEHLVIGDYTDVALDNAMRVKSGDTGFTFRAEAKQKYEIPTDLLYDEDVRTYLTTKDKVAERRMVEKFPEVICSAPGVAKQRLFVGGEYNG
jgi:hypothetical protein